MGWTTPTDRSTGYVVSAADWNIVEDDLAFLYGDTAWTAVTAFANSWVNYGAPYYSAAYRKVGTRVYVRGMIKSGTINTAAFTLPTGYRPASTAVFAVDSGGAFGVVGVDSSGNVTVSTGVNTFTSLDNVSFDTI